jgi:hypothetical protein
MCQALDFGVVLTSVTLRISQAGKSDAASINVWDQTPGPFRG